MIALTPDLEEAVAFGYARRDRANMVPTIAYFEQLLAQHPEHPVLTYEVAGTYDSAGEEATARTYYERALELGLDGEPLRRCLCQYGSTLRWLGELELSLAVLERARAEFPESASASSRPSPSTTSAAPTKRSACCSASSPSTAR
jgi:tetratricopeptide (TPR) repeat protein